MNTATVTRIIEQTYVPRIIAEGRHRRSFYESVGHPLPPEPEGMTDRDLALWYLDVLGA